MIDITTDHGFELVEGIWKSLVDTFPGGEYVSHKFARGIGDQRRLPVLTYWRTC